MYKQNNATLSFVSGTVRQNTTEPVRTAIIVVICIKKTLEYYTFFFGLERQFLDTGLLKPLA